MSQLRPGTILQNRYRIVGLIGTGGMGAVYLADDQRLMGRRCAIKEQIILDGPLAKTAQKQFEQEAAILAHLDHPGLPKVSNYFSGEAGDRDYLVMDYVPGQNLEQLIKKARRDGEFLDQAVVLNWIDQLCDILAYLHSRTPIVLHRDIKPANIKLTPDNRLKLVDFGLAKPFDPNDPRTVTGLQGLGSLPYTPIEQYVGHMGHTDARSDLYALGATCYHLFTCQVPSSANDYFLNPASLVPPIKINTHLSLPINQAILWAMQLHPKDRPTDIAAWQAALRSSQSHPGEPNGPALSSRPSGSDPILPQPKTSPVDIVRENSVLFGIAIVVLILALLITFGG